MEAKYTIKMIFSPRNISAKPEDFTRSFISMAELEEWVKMNNFILGTPQVHTSYFSVEHANGSPLEDDEIARVKAFASREMFAERIIAAVGERKVSATPYLIDPDAGAINAKMRTILRK